MNRLYAFSFQYFLNTKVTQKKSLKTDCFKVLHGPREFSSAVPPNTRITKPSAAFTFPLSLPAPLSVSSFLKMCLILQHRFVAILLPQPVFHVFGLQFTGMSQHPKLKCSSNYIKNNNNKRTGGYNFNVLFFLNLYIP